jgi:prepilin-type N-terminal cleavage/methylation domain-containing protein
VRRDDRGLTILELLFTVALLGTISAIAIPLTSRTVEHMRAAMAARYVSGLIMSARVAAVTRSAAVALRFEPTGDDYYFGTVLDGNGNGIRSAELRLGVDQPLTVPERLRDKFPGVSFAIDAGVPDLDGISGARRDGVRIGSARILTLTPDGTATPGTLYVCGRNVQYAVRVLGATGRTRVLHFRTGEHMWVSQ